MVMNASIRMLLLGWMMVLVGCPATDSTNSSRPKKRLQVVSTVGMVADLVRSVAGDRVEVAQLMGSGVDPHLYQATRDDVGAIMAADAVFYCGLMLEGKMSDTLEKVGKSKKVIAVTASLDRSRLFEPPNSHGQFDPHVWMDVSLWTECLPVIEKALAEMLPEHASEFSQNAQATRQQLAKLHEYGKTVLGTVPKDRRVLITSHDAFHYLGRAYDLEVLGVQGVSTESEAGLQRINQLVDLIVERKILAIFVESSVSSKNIQALIDGAASRGHEVKVGAELYSDAMGPSGTYTGTYVGMLDHNLTSIARALGGDAPVDGFQGKLGK